MHYKTFFSLIFLLITSCATISIFDQKAYENVVACKVDTLVLMSKATESYTVYKKELEELNKELDKAYEYDKNRRLNIITVQMWDKLRDPNSQLLGGFLKEWSENDHLLKRYVAHKQNQIGQGFDIIIQLESNKLR